MDRRLIPIREFPSEAARGLRGIFFDIDDTITWRGEIVPEAFAALHAARAAGLSLIAITGRPGGWVDHIARMWPVDGVVGENGGLWFTVRDGKMVRRFLQDEATRAENQSKLAQLATRILAAVPGTALASDQPYRDLDLAVDFCEDVPRLDDTAIDKIVAEFDAAGAVCKVSSIHVNGWFGQFDKLTGCRHLLADLREPGLDDAASTWAYFGDSANDEPMFRHFELSIGVANVRDFLPRMTAWPRFVTTGNGGHGFAEGVARILALRDQATG